nr:hypothetical protein [Pseudopedobacter sp.]
MDALIQFLKSWDIEAEVKSEKPISKNQKIEFSLSAGLWKDSDIDANELRKQAWSKKS